MGDISIVHVEEAFACGRRGALAVLIWRGAPTIERSERSFAAIGRAAVEAGGPIGMLAVIEPGSPPPPVTHFPRIARAFDETRALVATASVLEDRGLLAGRVLDAMTHVISLARGKHALKVCTDLGEAVAWMAPRLGAGSPEAFRAEALELVAVLRAKLPPAR